jgi:hypothetical protein
MRTAHTLSFALVLLAGAMSASQATTVIVPPADWAAMQVVSAPALGSGAASNELIYEFTVTPDQPLTITNTFTTSGYAPGAYEAGYVSPGWFMVRRACTSCGADGNVIWDMAKPYTAVFNSAYTMILIGGAGRGDEVADYLPGATYQSTMSWNRAAATIDITVTGPGLNVTRQIASSGDTITGLVFRGPNYDQMGASAFGNLSVVTQAVPEPGTYGLMFAGVATIGFIVRRRFG